MKAPWRKPGVDGRKRVESRRDATEKRTFEDEFLAFLKAAGVDYDPRFVFD